MNSRDPRKSWKSVSVRKFTFVITKSCNVDIHWYFCATNYVRLMHDGTDYQPSPLPRAACVIRTISKNIRSPPADDQIWSPDLLLAPCCSRCVHSTPKLVMRSPLTIPKHKIVATIFLLKKNRQKTLFLAIFHILLALFVHFLTLLVQM